MPDISHKVLSGTLRHLAREGLVARVVQGPRAAGVEYRLTRHGESAVALVHAVRAWGRAHLAERAAPR